MANWADYSAQLNAASTNSVKATRTASSGPNSPRNSSAPSIFTKPEGQYIKDESKHFDIDVERGLLKLQIEDEKKTAAKNSKQPFSTTELKEAYLNVMDELKCGIAKKGRGSKDYDRILSDFSDNGVIGDGAAKSQFNDDTIQQDIAGLSQAYLHSNFTANVGGKPVEYRGTYDDDDKKYKTGHDPSTKIKTK